MELILTNEIEMRNRYKRNYIVPSCNAVQTDKNNHIHGFMWGVTIPPDTDFKRLVEPLGHELVITTRYFIWMYLPIHALIPIAI